MVDLAFDQPAVISSQKRIAEWREVIRMRVTLVKATTYSTHIIRFSTIRACPSLAGVGNADALHSMIESKGEPFRALFTRITPRRARFTLTNRHLHRSETPARDMTARNSHLRRVCRICRVYTQRYEKCSNSIMIGVNGIDGSIPKPQFSTGATVI